jgi:integrase
VNLEAKLGRLTRLHGILETADPSFSRGVEWHQRSRSWLMPGRIRFAHDPFGALITVFAWSDTLEWLENNPWAVLTYARTLLDILKQQQLTDKAGPRRTAGRIARRYLIGIRQNPEWIDSDLYSAAIERSGMLPRLHVPRGAEIVFNPASDAVVREAKVGLKRLHAGVPVGGRRGSIPAFDSLSARAGELDLPGRLSDSGGLNYYPPRKLSHVFDRRKFRGAALQHLAPMAAVSSAMAPDYSALEPAWILARYFAEAKQQTVAELPALQLVILTVCGIALYTGIPLFDVLQLGLRGESPLGLLTPIGLDIELGGGIYPLATTVYDRSTVAFSHPPELQPFIDRLCALPAAELPATAIIDLLPRKPQTTIVETLRSFFASKGWKTGSRLPLVHEVFRAFAVDRLHISVPVAGLLVGRPINLSFGSSAYVSRPASEIAKLQGLVQAQLRREFGLPEQPLVVREQANHVGSRSIPPRQFWKEFGLRCEVLGGRNDLVALIELFFRGLSKRRAVSHSNPKRYLKSFAGSHYIVFADKYVGQILRRRGFLPVSDELRTLIEAADALCAGGDELLYEAGGHLVPFRQLSSREKSRLQNILCPHGFINAGRTSFYNLLVDEDVGEVLRDLVCGHGATDFLYHGALNPLPLAALLAEARPKYQRIYRKYAIDKAAGALVERITAHTSLSVQPTQTVVLADTAAVIEHRQEIDASVAERIISPTVDAEQYFADVLHSSLVDLREIGSPRALAILLALELHLPLSCLLRHWSYYTNESFWLDQSTRMIRFRVILDHGDKGGLSELSIPVCREDAPDKPLCYQLSCDRWEKFWSDRHRNGCQDETSQRRKSIFYGKAPTKAAFGTIIKKLLRAKLGPVEIENETAFKLLDQITSYQAVLSYGGTLANAIAGKGALDLNRVDTVPSVLAQRSSGDGRGDRLNGDAIKRSRIGLVSDRNAEANIALGVAKRRGRPSKWPINCRERGDWASWSADEFADFFLAYEVTPSLRYFARTLGKLGIAEAASSKMARRIMHRFDEAGAAQLSRTVPLLDRQHVRAFTERIACEINLRYAGSEALQKEAYQFFLLLFCAAARTGEVAGLRKQDILILPSDVWVRIASGKTGAARRWISLRMISPDHALYDALREYLEKMVPTFKARTHETLWPALVHEYPASFKTPTKRKRNRGVTRFACPLHVKTISRRLERWVNAVMPGAKPHSIRHWSLIFALQRAIDETLMRGNFFARLCLLSVMAGHCCVAITLNTYAGSAMATLKIGSQPPVTELRREENEKSPPAASHNKSRSSVAAAVTALKRHYAGLDHCTSMLTKEAGVILETLKFGLNSIDSDRVLYFLPRAPKEPADYPASFDITFRTLAPREELRAWQAQMIAKCTESGLPLRVTADARRGLDQTFVKESLLKTGYAFRAV